MGRLSYLILLSALTACGEATRPTIGVPTLDDAGTDHFVAVSSGREHSCGLRSDGVAFCWGSNEFSQLGAADNGSRCAREDRRIACRLEPVAVIGGIAFKKVSAGGDHTCAIGVDDRIYCWGDNLHGALGDPSIRVSATPVLAVTGGIFVDITSGGSHSCAVRSDGVVHCWGANDFGQLGLATVGSGAAAPTPVQTTQRFVNVVAGDKRTCARQIDGVVFCWGQTWLSKQFVQADSIRVQAAPQRLTTGPGFESITVGGTSTCGIGLDGRAYCWESNRSGTFGDGTVTSASIPQAVKAQVSLVAVSSGATHTCGIAVSGLAYCWGSDSRQQLGISLALVDQRCSVDNLPCSRLPGRVSGWRVFSQISAGLGDHTCGLTLGGNIYCWGAGSMGQRGDGRTTDEWAPIKIKLP